jgi:diguanylate cyclase (GGDEF)-like protein/PAS domain S-box-containing protein
VHLSARLLDTASYAYNPYALPLFVCAFIALVLGFVIVIRDRGSRVGLIHFVETIAIGIWFVGFGFAYLAADAGVADDWFRIGYLGIAFIPVLTLQFACSVVGSRAGLNGLLWFGWVAAIGFATAALFVPAFLGTPYHYWWGYYVRSTVYSVLYIPLIVVFFAVALRQFHRRYRNAHPSSNASRRTKLFLISFSLGSLGMFDLVPSLGVPLYPFGYIPTISGILFATYITLRHRLMDITPEFAARQIVETVSDGLLLLDHEGVMRVANETLLSMIRLPKEAIIGKVIPAHLRKLLSRQELGSIQAGVPMHNREIEYQRHDGSTMILSFAVSVIRGPDHHVDAYVCAVRDVTEQKRTDQRVRFLAYYDNLTGLPNRQQFQDRLRSALTRAASHQRQVALLFLDLDRFKRINDTLGHALGDALLQAVAGRIINCVRKMRTGNHADEDTVARLGGDEFIVGLYDLECQDDATRVAERILASIADPMRLDQHEITVTASLGISIFPQDGADAETLLKNADAAMYQVKELGGNDLFFYERSRSAKPIHHLSLEHRLRSALEDGHLSLHYQPVVATHTGQTVSVEALLRWHDPDYGPVSPDRLIAIAEESGLILPIGMWVLRQACAQARAWQDAGMPFSQVAVNVSARQFHDRDLVGSVRDALEAADLNADRLDLELTECTVMQDTLHTRRTLEDLKTMGAHLSIDDFGTGYSSLGYLRRFPIDALKIDRSFVHDIGTERDNGAIVAAIIAMARSLKIGVIGEGVETEEQSAFLQLHGCKLAQGYYFCQPLPATELAAWLQAHPERLAL